jgi:GntR family transcriptional repressor for pyruvate dehydrogenase complex
MQSLLEQNVLQNLQVLVQKNDVSEQLAEHRKLLMDAVIEGNPEQARLASNAHLAFIEEALLEADKERSRIARSLRRTSNNRVR